MHMHVNVYRMYNYNVFCLIYNLVHTHTHTISANPPSILFQSWIHTGRLGSPPTTSTAGE